jgi:predicted flap endonuclease-1-like 5' DNA nuclease
MAKLDHVEGIGPVNAQKLAGAGVANTQDLLKVGGTPKGRKELAAASGISETLILEWVNHVDLFRIKGVGSEYADLLEEAGVDTVPELARRNAANLHQKMVDVNQAKELVRRVPVKSQVEDWIRQANELPRAVHY